MIVRAVYEFDVDIDDFTPKFVDIDGLAKDLTRREIASLIENRELTEDDFTYATENELIKRNEMHFKSIMALTKSTNMNRQIPDIKVSREQFLNMYESALQDMFDNPVKEDNDIYSYPISVHWHGIYCDCGDGAVPANYIISAIKNVCNELDN